MKDKTLLISLVLTAIAFGQASHGQPFIAQGPNGNYYEIVPFEAISWDDANSEAGTRFLGVKQGHLATITSTQENDFIHALRSDVVQNLGLIPQFWIGGFQTDKSDEPSGNWQWVNGEGPIPGDNFSFAFANWAVGEPNDCGGVEEHLTVGRFDYEPGWNFDGSLWNDEGCGPGFIGGYIVEYEVEPTVVIDGCNSGVENRIVDENAYLHISDLVAACVFEAKNHGAFVKCVSYLTNELKKTGILSGAEKGAIQSCAAKSNLP